MSDVGLFVRGKWFWDLSFRRIIIGWEQKIYASFMNLINFRCSAENPGDYLIWCVNGNCYFSIKGLCNWVEYKLYEEEESVVLDHIIKSLTQSKFIILASMSQ